MNLLVGSLLTAPAHAVTIKNFDEIERALNTKAWKEQRPKTRVKVAVLDKGFFGYEQEIGKTLPADTRYIPGPIPAPPEAKVTHGLAMAQLMAGIAGDPELYLYNVYGYSNLKAAIEDLVAQGIELVLYSEVWEFGGNHDGKGFINALVNQALDAGVVWVNAAGNFGLTTYVSAIETDDQDWVKLPDQNKSLKIQCNKKGKEKCQIRIVLSWNDFKDDPTLGSDKDLDIALADDMMNIIENSSLKQTSNPEEQRPGFSSYPRETMIKEVGPGAYHLRIKNRSKNFSKDDELMITVDGDGITMPNHTKDKVVLNPADNPRVITVGALDSDRSSFNSKLNKPNILAMSSVKTPEGEFRGSSNSAALVAGAMALVKSRSPRKDFFRILQESTLPGWDDNQRGLSMQTMSFSAPQRNCFPASEISQQDLPQHLMDIINAGAILVQTSSGARLMTPYDPSYLDSGLKRQLQNDMILTTPHGLKTNSRFGRGPLLPSDWAEIFQIPRELGLCDKPSQPVGRIFRL
jgi:hypothetical protein